MYEGVVEAARNLGRHEGVAILGGLIGMGLAIQERGKVCFFCKGGGHRRTFKSWQMGTFETILCSPCMGSGRVSHATKQPSEGVK